MTTARRTCEPGSHMMLTTKIWSPSSSSARLTASWSATRPLGDSVTTWHSLRPAIARYEAFSGLNAMHSTSNGTLTVALIRALLRSTTCVNLRDEDDDDDDDDDDDVKGVDGAVSANDAASSSVTLSRSATANTPRTLAHSALRVVACTPSSDLSSRPASPSYLSLASKLPGLSDRRTWKASVRQTMVLSVVSRRSTLLCVSSPSSAFGTH